MKTIFFPKGGTNMIAVEKVAEAVVCAAENGTHGSRYPIGDINMDFNTMLNIMLDELGTPKRIINIPKLLLVLNGKKRNKDHAKEGKESGLDTVWLMKDLLTANLYFDAKKESMDLLGYTGGGVEEAIRKTVRACM
jgi:nucleoside-diphosphate-sugar epimerase